MNVKNALRMTGLLLMLGGLAFFAGAYFDPQPDLYGVGAALVCIGGLFVALGGNKSANSK